MGNVLSIKRLGGKCSMFNVLGSMLLGDGSEIIGNRPWKNSFKI